ncbi:hypothetical protein RND81_08G104000 [Saponaria officinalis]|uniref:Uncharacterized protein n=1 Tax=Saponaria officinalis TaxID=3572 RepID=A0AAW1J767_SAPOF
MVGEKFLKLICLLILLTTVALSFSAKVVESRSLDAKIGVDDIVNVIACQTHVDCNNIDCPHLCPALCINSHCDCSCS